MKFPKYWARSDLQPSTGSSGNPLPVSCWHWSDESVQDAKNKAQARAASLSQKFDSGIPLDRYPYGQGDRPLREEVVQIDSAGFQDGSAVITRNLYGALILNAAQAMFIDVDFASQAPPPKSGGFFKRLFAKPSPDELEKRSLEQIRNWTAQRPELGIRLYRTFAGIRCLITNQIFDPAGSDTIEMLQSIGSDPLYIRLCKAQSCFRARLTPKPWRCGAARPPSQYPRLDPEQESRFRAWQSEYDQVIADYSVCRFLEQVGPLAEHPSVSPIVQLHDRFTNAQIDRPLA